MPDASGGLVYNASTYGRSGFAGEHFVGNNQPRLFRNSFVVAVDVYRIGVVSTRRERDSLNCGVLPLEAPLLKGKEFCNRNPIVPVLIGEKLNKIKSASLFGRLLPGVRVLYEDLQALPSDKRRLDRGGPSSEPSSSALGVHDIRVVTDNENPHRYQRVEEYCPEGSDVPSKSFAVLCVLAAALGFILAHKGVQRLDQIGIILIALGWILAAGGLYSATQALHFVL